MSTSELFLLPEELEDFLQGTLAEDGMYVTGDEGREIGLCPYISFYNYNKPEQFVPLAAQMIQIFNEFKNEIIDEPFQLIWHHKSQDWLEPGDTKLLDDPMPDVLEALINMQRFTLRATDQQSTANSARWAIDGTVDDGLGDSYTYLKVTFRNRWYRKNTAKWHAFAERCIARLQPDQCYSGFEVGNGGSNILGAYECDVLERICADHFFGMDIDHPGPMSFHNFNQEDDYRDEVSLAGGIRTPTWCFLLSPYWQARLDKTETQIRSE